MVEKKIHEYNSDDIDVTWDGKRCIHYKACVRNLSDVFDVDQRPWVQPGEADADAVADVVEMCPTGALHYDRKDGGDPESVPDENTLRIEENGPIYARGDVRIQHSNGGETILNDTRVALCRCGMAENKPLCDGTHEKTGFKAKDNLAANMDDSGESGDSDHITLTPSENGPLHLTGDFTLHSSDGETVFEGGDVWLCRCGGSQNKPFCDGTHSKIDFRAEG